MINIKVCDEKGNSSIIQIKSRGINVKEFLTKIKEETNIKIPENENEIQIINKTQDRTIKGDLQLLNNDEIVIKNRKGNESMYFIDITKGTIRIIKPENDSSIPDYLTAQPGLNIFGRCENQQCELNDKDMIIPIEEDEYDIIETKAIVKCIKCKCNVIGKNIGFYSCYYNYYGKKYENKKVEEFGEKIDDFQKLIIPSDKMINIKGKSYEIHKAKDIDYFEYDINEVNFLELIIQVKKILN